LLAEPRPVYHPYHGGGGNRAVLPSPSRSSWTRLASPAVQPEPGRATP
jgi:hypothetical protein